MKRKVLFLLTAVMVFSFAACGEVKDESTDAVTEESADATEDTQEEAIEEDTEEELFVIETPSYYLANYDKDEDEPLLTYSTQGLYLVNDGWENLKTAFDAYTQEKKEELDSEYESVLATLDDYSEADEYSYESSVSITRADETVVSILNGTYSYLGGAHPNYVLSGYNYDSKTGEKLEIEDVVNDVDAFYNAVISQIEESEYATEEMVYEDWQNTVYAYFYDDTYSLVWNFTNEGLEVTFNPYELAPYAVGMITLDFSYDEYASLLKEEYVEEEGLLCKEISSYADYELDIDGDGETEAVRVETNDDYENDSTFELSVIVTVNGSQKTVLRDVNNSFNRAFLVENAEGEYYIYADIISDNDYHYLEVFDINDTSNGPSYIGYSDCGAAYEGMILNSEHFILSDRVNTLGSYTGYRECYVGEDGLPVAYGSEYMIKNYENIFGEDTLETERYLTLTQDLEVTVSDDKNFETTTEETLSSGDNIYPYATDAESYMIFKLSDGRFAKVEIVKDEEEYVYYVNGINENDLFESVPYAG
ncbi:MAG: DUF3298 and DUF4163 domain-containing protein [Eubacterium sp.]|nr:DUF3298 and DUF4163 domain-containing protein [Eubacterium sp.]